MKHEPLIINFLTAITKFVNSCKSFMKDNIFYFQLFAIARALALWSVDFYRKIVFLLR